MPKLTGVFELFRFLDQIPASDINRWLKSKMEVHQLENFVGNRILYPQTLPLTSQEMEIDLAIFREALKRQPEVLFDKDDKRIIIPESMKARFSSIEVLLRVALQAVNPKGVRLVYLKGPNSLQLLGSVFTPDSLPNTMIVSLTINSQPLTLRTGQIILLPFKEQQLSIKFGSSDQFTAAGGGMGLMVDLRGGGYAA